MSGDDVVPLVARLVTLRHRMSCDPTSRRLRQQYFALNLSLHLLGYDFLLESGDTWENAIRSPSPIL